MSATIGAGAVLLVAAWSGGIRAAESRRVDSLSLDQALALAGQHHPELAEARALADAAVGRAQQAGVLPNPELLGRIEALPLERNRGLDPDYLIGLSQAVPLGGRLGNAREAERWGRIRADWETSLKYLEVRKAVHGAFATALYQDQAGRLLSEITADLEASVRIAQALVEQGDAAPDELARARMALARSRIEHQRSQALMRQAHAALAAAVGMPSLVVGKLEGTLEAVLELDAIETVAVELENNPAQGIAQATIAEKRARIELARVERIPDIKVEALYRRSESSNGIDLGVAIPLPLFDRGQGRIEGARAELAAAEARARVNAGHLERRLRESGALLSAAVARARAMRAEILPQADTLRASMAERHRAGDISLAELIPVNRDWAVLQLTYLETVLDVVTAWTEVRALAGEL